jgi:hypothetical protein
MKENEEVIGRAFDLYKQYYLRAVLLEIFGKNSPTNSNSEIKEWLLSEVRKVDELYHSVTMSEVMTEYEYLVKIGYLNMVDDNTKMTLSEHGMKALRECVWESLASTAFLGHKSLLISNKSLVVSKRALSVSRLTLFISFIAMLMAWLSYHCT